MRSLLNSKASIFFVIFLSLCSLSLSGATPKLHEKLGGKNLKILEDATFVTILTLESKGTQNRNVPTSEIHLNQNEIDRLKRNLLDDHNYDFARVKSCQFLPEVSFKFRDEQGDAVHVFVSPSCNQILFGLDARSVLLNYDPVHERLEYFVQQLIKDVKNRNKETALW